MNSNTNGHSGAAVTDVTTHAAPTRKSILRRLLPAAMLTCIALLAGVVAVWRAWPSTQLREAYLPDLRALARQRPFDARLLMVLAGRQAQARQFVEAGQTCARAIAAGENTPLMWLTWAATSAAAGDRVQAGATLLLGMRQPALAPELRDALRRCAALPPDAPPGVVAQAICPIGPQALIDPNTRGNFLNGIVAWYGRHHPASSGFSTRAAWVREQPGSLLARQLWADALLRNECYAQAEAAARRTLELSPDSLAAHLDLADALYHQGLGGKAGLEYARAAKAHPDSLRALLGLGQVVLDRKMLAMGVQVYTKAVKLAPNSADAWAGLGRAYYNQSLDLGSALSAFQTASKLAPARTDFFPAYAEALRAQAQYAQAETLLRKRLAVAPQEAATWYDLAQILLAYQVTAPRRAEAEACLRQAISLEPRGIPAISSLGRLLVQERRYGEATPYLEQALRANRRDTAAAIALVRSYRGAGRLQDALRARAQMAAIIAYSTEVRQSEDELGRHPLDANLYLRTARLYDRGGESAKARNYRNAAAMLLQHPQRATRTITVLRQAVSQSAKSTDAPATQP